MKTQNEILEIVDRICNTPSTNCRSLNKWEDAKLLMDMISVPQNAEIGEIPLDWNRQVVILFSIPNDNNYYSIFTGIGNDGNFYFQLTIDGVTDENGVFDFYMEDEVIHLQTDYFTNKYKEDSKMKKLTFNELKEQREKWNTAVIVFTENSFDKIYSLESRSYRLSDNDMWGLDDTKMGRRISADCLDGTDINVRLDHYMSYNDDVKNGWVIDYCYIEKLN